MRLALVGTDDCGMRQDVKMFERDIWQNVEGLVDMSLSWAWSIDGCRLIARFIALGVSLSPARKLILWCRCS